MAYNKNGPVHQGRKGRYVGTHWYDDIVVQPDDQRVMPDTIPHDYVAAHQPGCACEACESYPDELRATLKQRWIRSAARRR